MFFLPWKWQSMWKVTPLSCTWNSFAILFYNICSSVWQQKVLWANRSILFFFFFCIFSLILVFVCFAADLECCSRQKKSNHHEIYFSICSLLKCSNVPDQHQKETFRREENTLACCTPRQFHLWWEGESPFIMPLITQKRSQENPGHKPRESYNI